MDAFARLSCDMSKSTTRMGVLEDPDKQSWTFSKTEDSRKLSKIKTEREQEEGVSRCFKTCLKMFEAKYVQISCDLWCTCFEYFKFQTRFFAPRSQDGQLNVARKVSSLADSVVNQVESPGT